MNLFKFLKKVAEITINKFWQEPDTAAKEKQRGKTTRK